MNFDREAAVRDWRTSILSRGGLTVSEVDELEDHLELVEADLQGNLRPNEAFWLAAHRVGTPDVLTREFAKVRPNMGWEVRGQWALLGMLAFLLLTPLMNALLFLIVAGAAQVPFLTGFAAALYIYVIPFSLLLVIPVVAVVVRVTRAAPSVVERAISRFTSWGWIGLVGAVLVLVAWQQVVNALHVSSFLLASEALEQPGRAAPIQSMFWYWLGSVLRDVRPAVVIGLIVWIQRRLERSRPARVPADAA